MTKANLHLQIAAVGWDYEHWHNGFYPFDLPPDWRLTYYANEFREVLVPASIWLYEPVPDLRQWYEDTPVEFRFYMQVTAALLSRSARSTFIPRLNLLKEKLGGIVMDRRSLAFARFTEALIAKCPEVEIFEATGELGEGELRCWHSAEGNAIGQLQGTGSADLRKLRTDLERFAEQAKAEQAVIFVEGDIKLVQDATVIARLLGY